MTNSLPVHFDTSVFVISTNIRQIVITIIAIDIDLPFVRQLTRVENFYFPFLWTMHEYLGNTLPRFPNTVGNSSESETPRRECFGYTTADRKSNNAGSINTISYFSRFRTRGSIPEYQTITEYFGPD